MSKELDNLQIKLIRSEAKEYGISEPEIEDIIRRCNNSIPCIEKEIESLLDRKLYIANQEIEKKKSNNLKRNFK